MRSRTYLVFTGVVLLIFSSICFLLPGCDDSDSSHADIIIWSDPDPISYTGSDGLWRYWCFTLYVEATSDTGARLLEWEYEVYDNEDNFRYGYTFSKNRFRTEFTACKPPYNNHLDAYSTICTEQCLTQCDDGGYVIQKMRFRYDKNIAFWITAKIAILPL